MTCTRVSHYGKKTIDFRKQTRNINVKLYIHQISFLCVLFQKMLWATKWYMLPFIGCPVFVSHVFKYRLYMRDHLDFAIVNDH